MKETKTVVSYFDVDGTLVKSNLIQPALYYLLHQRTPVESFARTARMVMSAPKLAYAEWKERSLFNVALFESYKGISEDRLRVLAGDVFQFVLRKHLFDEAKELVAKSKHLGHRVVFISGNLDLIVDKLAHHLHADEVIANKLEFQDRLATGKLLRPIVCGPEKARLICQHAATWGADLKDCYAYSDSYSDLPMLSVVGKPTVVNPDRKLKSCAQSYLWPSLYFGQSSEFNFGRKVFKGL